MRKEELRKLRTLNATSAMIKMAAGNEITPREYYTKDGYACRADRHYGLYMRCQNLSGYLKIAIFVPKDIEKGILTPCYEIFIDYKNNAYINRKLDDKGNEVSWDKKYIYNLLGGYMATYETYSYMYYSKNKSYINPEGSSTIKSLLGVKSGGYEGISKWQQKIRTAKKDEAEKRKTDEWDRDMALIPEYPPDFNNWWSKKVISNHFIFYDKPNKKYWCSYCEKEYGIGFEHPAVKPIRHNSKGKCPHCRKKVTYKNINQMSKVIESDTKTVEIIQPLKGNIGYVVRFAKVAVIYKKNAYRKPEYRLQEEERTLYRTLGIKQYYFGWYKNRIVRWYKCDNISTYQWTKPALYKKNIGYLTRNVLKHSFIKQYIKIFKDTNITQYLYEEYKHPEIEKLGKVGLVYIAHDIINSYRYRTDYINDKETELIKMLKIDKARLERLKAMEYPRLRHLLWLQAEKIENTKYDDYMIQFFSDNNLVPEDFEFLNGQMSYKQICNYIIKQQSISDDKPGSIKTTWKDYMNMATKAGLQVDNEQIYKPKDLKVAHSGVIVLLQKDGITSQAKQLHKKWPKVNKVCKELAKYEYAEGEYAVVAPKGIYDIVVEGTALSHCVHTCDFYFDRIQRKESFLLFLRKSSSPSTPWYTLEVEPSGNIRQKRTIGDNQNKDFQDAVEFLKQWQQVITSRLSEEDKKLAKKSDELRKKNYEELRRNGNKVWHGRLAGKLLVDVLEEDFMQVIMQEG